MDGSSLNSNPHPAATGVVPGAFVDEVDPWAQQVEYRNVKAEQQQLATQHYSSPNGTPDGYVAVTSAPPSSGSGVKTEIELLEAQQAQQAQDFSEMQRLSQEYTPEVTGSLVGELKSSKELAVEYANSDPTYVRKTANLAAKYDSYRTVRGDGNCGWRAVAFGFFELLLRSGDQNRIGMEYARITSLNGLMEATGYRSYIYEDFAEATFDLFTSLSSGAIAPNDDSALVKTFNDPDLSDSIVTHFKFLTSAWMKTSPENYQPFLDVPVAEYCSSRVEPYAVEIGHVGLIALIDCLILPAGLAVEVIYLDRSAGDEVTVHRFEKVEGDGVLTPPDAPVLRLLYRPGHYDIVYKVQDLPVVPVSEYELPPVQVSFLPTLPEQTFQSTPLAQFPAFSPPPLDFGYFDPSPVGHSLSFRQSMLSMPEFQPAPFQPQPFQTTTFRNSPFNPSHFQSENFQPEIYQPPTSPSAHSRKHDRHSDPS